MDNERIKLGYSYWYVYNMLGYKWHTSIFKMEEEERSTKVNYGNDRHNRRPPPKIDRQRSFMNGGENV